MKKKTDEEEEEERGDSPSRGSKKGFRWVTSGHRCVFVIQGAGPCHADL